MGELLPNGGRRRKHGIYLVLRELYICSTYYCVTVASYVLHQFESYLESSSCIVLLRKTKLDFDDVRKSESPNLIKLDPLRSRSLVLLCRCKRKGSNFNNSDITKRIYSN